MCDETLAAPDEFVNSRSGPGATHATTPSVHFAPGIGERSRFQFNKPDLKIKLTSAERSVQIRHVSDDYFLCFSHAEGPSVHSRYGPHHNAKT